MNNRWLWRTEQRSPEDVLKERRKFGGVGTAVRGHRFSCDDVEA